MAEAIVNSALLRLEQSILWRYSVAPVVVVLTLAVRTILASVVPNDSVFLYFLPPVLIAAGLSGLGPGLLATVLSIVAAVIFVNIDPTAHSKLFFANGVVFTVIAMGVSWGGELLRRSRRRANFMTHDALAREAHLQSILGSHDRHRRTRRHTVVQQRRRAAVRLPGG